jgi:hypothetical protein
MGKIFESSFLINLFGDTNVARIFYKSSQTYSTHINGDRYKGTKGVFTLPNWWKPLHLPNHVACPASIKP